MGIIARATTTLSTAMPASVRATALAVSLCLPALTGAQTARGVVGVVKDSLGHAIPGAEVRGRGGLLARTNDSGFFRIGQLPEGSRGLLVRRLGFAPSRVSLLNAGDSLNIALVAVATTLPSMRAQEVRDSLSHTVLADFWARRARGFGKFVTRDEIEARGPRDFVDIVRHLPSVRVQSHRGRPQLRFQRNAGRDCPPQYWVDGIPIESGSADEFMPDNVEALELYASPATTPPQFSKGAAACGAIVVWTRLPG